MSTTDPTTVLLFHGYREQELAARATELRDLAELRHRAELQAPGRQARRRARSLLRGWFTASPRQDARVAR
ncbi:hypothetical protein MF406_07170 [Georgenia sp. TF02-10]|uniref:hypothetical protein n=1 Tax=Georgenia sp. TF02-10 TaxID=2917725 RepID=UPI001FA6B40A|nr:hypothetical protein [Georgenia sp. TF02-10]UNX55994.1 hypothetical protein MF406_07170 [Georgenia sp. TF02-10]